MVSTNNKFFQSILESKKLVSNDYKLVPFFLSFDIVCHIYKVLNFQLNSSHLITTNNSIINIFFQIIFNLKQTKIFNIISNFKPLNKIIS